MYDLHFLSVVGTHFSRSGPNLSKERLLKGAECDTTHLTKMGRRLDRRPNHRRPIRPPGCGRVLCGAGCVGCGCGEVWGRSLRRTDEFISFSLNCLAVERDSETADKLTTDRRILFVLTELSGRRAIFGMCGGFRIDL